MVDWQLKHQRKRTKINKDNTHKNIEIVDYKIRVILILKNKSSYKYETPYNGISEITQFWTIGMFKLQIGAIQIRYNRHHIKTYKSDNQC